MSEERNVEKKMKSHVKLMPSGGDYEDKDGRRRALCPQTTKELLCLCMENRLYKNEFHNPKCRTMVKKLKMRKGNK